MPSKEYEIDPPMDPDPSWPPAMKPDKPSGPSGPQGPALTTVVDGTGDIRPMTGVLTPPITSGPSGPPVILDPRWAVENAMMSMVEVSRRKRADYATDGDEFSNFRGTAAFAGFESPALSALFNVQQKLERIRALRANGRLAEVANESVDDTFLDIAVYAVLAHAMWLEEKAAAEG